MNIPSVHLCMKLCPGVLHVGRKGGQSVMVKCVRLFQPLNESELLPPQPLQELQSSMENSKRKRKFREGEEEEEGQKPRTKKRKHN